jgi:Acetyltransferase (GNAT) domain
MGMLTDLATVDPISYPGWDNIVRAHQGHSFFHTSFWARTLLDTYNFVPLYFSLVQNGKLAVLIPVMEIRNALIRKKGVSLPFTDMSDPIIDAEIPWRDVYDELTMYGKSAGWKSLEIRGDDHVNDESIPSTDYFNHTLPLESDENAVLRGFSDGTKGNIKKAEREGVEVAITTDRSSLEEFYKLHSATRKRHGLPPQPASFFSAVYTNVLATNNGFVTLARLKGKPIAGAVFFHFGSKAIYKYSASDMAFQNMRANNLVLWESIRWFCRNKITTLCMGRTEPENDGLRHYKSGWGAHEKVLKYYKYDFSRKAFVKENSRVPVFYETIFRNMPSPLLNALGSVLYKYVA